jgi:hypothetical protein
MLRLVYWYDRCYLLQSNDTFKHKRSEVKRKLTRGLLKEREKISKQMSIDANNVLNTLVLNWEDIISRFKSKVIDQELRQTSERYRTAWFKDVWNVTSELLFAALCGESGFTITFEPSSKDHDHDYDFVMNGYPVQMKSLNVSGSIESAVDKMKQRKQSVDKGEVTYDYVVQKIIDAIRDNIDEVEYALEQRAKIIFMNGTTDESSGSYLGQLSLEKPRHFTLTKSIELSIALVEKDRSSVPLIFCATAFRSTYYINSLTIKIPITEQSKVDKDKDIEPLLGQQSGLAI